VPFVVIVLDLMANRCLLYYITDRTALAPDEPTRRKLLLRKIVEAANAGVDYIQLREKDLPTRELESLAGEAAAVIRKRRTETRELRTALLINSRTDVALAAQADGVHLRGDDVSPQEVRAVWAKCGAGAPARELSPREPVIAVSCHSPEEVFEAAASSPTFAVFAPVFEKKDVPGMPPTGLAKLSEACKAKIPVLALGGITVSNARSCLEAGASGIAAIRLFQENDIAEMVRNFQ
jgi:thiamine-phosphate pyrophosphorylase